MAKRRLTTLLVTAVAALGISGASALAHPEDDGNGKCNAGRGNGSEPAGPGCIGGDPGNSFEHNRGGDDLGLGGLPVRGGTGVE